MTDARLSLPRAAQPHREPASSRLTWPDLARGITVLLVVAMHVHFLQLAVLLPGAPATDLNFQLIDLATPVRMPLFFVLSGFLSARMLQRSWRAGISGRIAPRFYLYVVWLAITGLVLALEATATAYPYSFWEYTLPQLLVPQSVLWYLWALAAYFALTRATRAIPAWIAVGGALGASLLGAAMTEGAMTPIVVAFVWFLVGARLPELVRGLTERTGMRVALATTALAVGLLALRGANPEQAMLDLATSVACLAAVLMLLPRVSGARLLRPIRHIGRNTLPIFALHPLLIIGGNRLLLEWGWLQEQIDQRFWWSLLAPVVEVLLIVVVSLWIHRLAYRVGLGTLFEMPRFRALRQRIRVDRERLGAAA